MKRTNLILVAAAALLFCGARQANADAITYTESGTATGSIGLTTFTDALVTITFVGDTSNVSGGFGSFTNPVGTATVAIAGIGNGPFAFTDSLYVFVNQAASVVGIADSTVNDILDTINGSAFNTYDLTTSIGPVTGLSDSNAGTGSTYGTSKGLLAFNNMSLNSTFAATTAAAAVPEPSSLVLLGAAAIAGLLMLRRGRLL